MFSGLPYLVKSKREVGPRWLTSEYALEINRTELVYWKRLKFCMLGRCLNIAPKISPVRSLVTSLALLRDDNLKGVKIQMRVAIRWPIALRLAIYGLLWGVFCLMGLVVQGQVLPTDTVSPQTQAPLRVVGDSTKVDSPAKGKSALKVDSVQRGRSVVERQTDASGIRRDSVRAARQMRLQVNHNPNSAVRRSLVLPGWGQVYNRKAWKVPIIYGGFAAFGFFIVDNNIQYHKYRKAVLCRQDTTANCIDDYPDLDVNNLISIREYHRRFRDLNIIFAALWYTLQAVDAYVDGHMARFDVSEDLSLELMPQFEFNPYNHRQFTTGVTINLQLKR